MRNIKSKFLTLSGLLLSASSFAALDARLDLHSKEQINTDEIKTAIIINRAKWMAGPNRITAMTKPQIQRMLGSLDHPALYDVQFESVSPIKGLTLAAAVDWRDVQGTNFVSPILNQGNCGSCVSFAAVATLETQVNIAAGPNKIFNPKYSTQALFACGGGSCGWGWYPGSAASYLESKGVPDEACAPYVSGATGKDVRCSSICADAAARSTKILDTVRPSGRTLSREAVKEALNHGPLMTTLSVYDDFAAYKGGIYKHVSGNLLGGHAVSLVGYNDYERYWLVRNSWGEDWGEKGFVRVSYDDTSGIAESTWGFAVSPVEGFLKVEAPRDRAFVSNVMNAQVISTFSEVASLRVVLKNLNTSRQVLDVGCDEAPCAPSIDTNTLADGEYEILAQAMRKGQKVQSQAKRFFVSNFENPLRLAFKGSNVNLAQPLSDRVEFDLKIDSGLVPLSKLTFHAKKVGDENAAEFKKETNLVLPAMTMGWRTPSVADGQYEIWFSGEQPAGGKLSTVESERLVVSVSNMN